MFLCVLKKAKNERIQHFEGDVIAMHKKGISSTFTVRRIGANSIAVERVFPLYSPIIEAISFVRRGDVRRAKLYYMRRRIGKAARVAEKVMTREQRELHKKSLTKNKQQKANSFFCRDCFEVLSYYFVLFCVRNTLFYCRLQTSCS